MDKLNKRKTSFKAPPNALIDGRQSQQSRRNHALEEQKRKRLQRVDASRQLDLFADLHLGLSDDEVEGETQNVGPEIVREGVTQFAALLAPSQNDIKSTCAEGVMESESTQSQSKKNDGKKGTGKGKSRRRKPSSWADRCMYAELLEMQEESPSTASDWSEQLPNDGLPEDLETGWVAVAPVPVGKRCLAVTQQSAGVSGVVPNTMLRSRVLGKAIIAPFPSPFPASTVLDCILDQNWRDSGILHILDVIRWKGQDVGDCEAGFRFWWRDMRLSELPDFSPLSSISRPQVYGKDMDSSPSTGYRFSYPSTFLPIPYSTSTTYTSLLTNIIPQASSSRSVHVHVPQSTSQREHNADEMQIDEGPTMKLMPIDVEIKPDGLLLYVAQASYESGTSPLSSWVPIADHHPHISAVDEQAGRSNATHYGTDGPLALFERLIRQRLQSRNSQ